MKKKLWVSRDKDGYTLWDDKPIFRNGIYEETLTATPVKVIGLVYVDMTEADFKSAFFAFDIKLAMNQLKRIELTIKAEVKEIG
jgi:hypothetical protein